MAANQTTTAPAPTIPGQEDTHHYVLTLQVPSRSGFDIASWTGTFTAQPGTTVYDVYRGLRADIAHTHPQFERGTVLCFNVQPNQL